MATEPSHFLKSKLVRIVTGQRLRISNCHGKCKHACLSLLAWPNYTNASRCLQLVRLLNHWRDEEGEVRGPRGQNRSNSLQAANAMLQGKKVKCFKDVQSSSRLNQLRYNPSLSDIFAKEKCGGTDPLGSLRTLL